MRLLASHGILPVPRCHGQRSCRTLCLAVGGCPVHRSWQCSTQGFLQMIKQRFVGFITTSEARTGYMPSDRKRGVSDHRGAVNKVAQPRKLFATMCVGGRACPLISAVSKRCRGCSRLRFSYGSYEAGTVRCFWLRYAAFGWYVCVCVTYTRTGQHP